MRSVTMFAAALLLAGTALARPDKGTGGGKTNPSGPTMTINAVDAPSGDYGRVHYQDSNDAYFSADLECVNVSGNSTWFAGILTSVVNFGASVGDWIWGRAIDYGGRNTDEIRYQITGNGEEAMSGCENYQDPQGSAFYINQGNVDVRDR